MHEYDTALKSVLRRVKGSALRELTGLSVVRWHNTDLPAVQNRRADMLGETADGTLLHIELQSTNEAGMALRMLEYAAAIYRRFGRFPQQMVLYVGEKKLRMRGDLKGPHLDFQCRIADIRELNGDRLIGTGRVEDNVLAVLARLGDSDTAIRRILRRIAGCGPERRADAFRELMLLAGLRHLGPVITREANEMPILNDIMDHEVFGPKIREGMEKGLQKGLQKGLEKGLTKGRREGERTIVLRQIAQRFGSVPPATLKRIEALPSSKLERLAVRLLDATSLDDLLG